MSRFQWVKDSYDKGKDVKEKVEKVLNPVPPQPGLIPVGGNFYATPPTPQPPNYEDPFSDTPIGLDIEIVKDECNLGVQVTGSLMFMKLPSFQFVWRNPSCSPREQPFELPRPPSRPSTSDKYFVLGYIAYWASCREQNPYRFPYLIIDGFGYNFQSSGIGEEWDSSGVVQILSTSGRIVETPFYTRWYGQVIYKVKSRWRKKRFSYKNLDFNFFGVGILWEERAEEIYFEGESEAIFVTTRDDNGWSLGQPLFGATFPDYTPLDWRISGGFYYDESPDAVIEYFDDSRLWTRFREKKIYEARFNNPWWTPDVAAQGAKYKTIGGDGRIFVDDPYNIVGYRTQGTTYIHLIDGTLDMSEVPCPNLSVKFKCKIPKPPPPPPPMKKDCCDDLHDKLNLILKRIGDLPAFVPNLLTQKHPELIKKESLAELILWTTKQVDAVSGKYPLEVKIQDVDPVKKGNQEKIVTLPNQAELLADIYQTVLTMKQVNDALLPIALKTLCETGSIKMTAIATHDLAFGNADFLGWDIVQTKDKVKFSFNPIADPEAPMSEMLEQSEIEVKGYENKDKKDFRTWVIPLARMAQAWMAQNFRKVPNQDALKDLLGKTPDSVVEQAEQEKSEDEDFDVFLNNFQSGFTTEAGISEPTKPFGDDYELRPRVREFGGEDAVVD